MTEVDSEVLTTSGDDEAIRHLTEAIASGKHWYLALLEAIGLWSSAEETYDGRVWRYLIGGEAFDWLLLVQRLCEAAVSLMPQKEVDSLLFHGEPPIDITQDEFKELIGSRKYHQYLNYFYGITVEESLILAVQDEVRKERSGWGLGMEYDTTDETYRRIYGDTQEVLLNQFRREKGYPMLHSITLTELKEFTYWLFKYRLKVCEKARVASDTKKALDHLRTNLPYRLTEPPAA
jgi:hypothetical protein